MRTCSMMHKLIIIAIMNRVFMHLVFLMGGMSTWLVDMCRGDSIAVTKELPCIIMIEQLVKHDQPAVALHAAEWAS